MKPQESLLRAYIENHPDDAARAFEGLSSADSLTIFRKLPKKAASELLERLDTKRGAQILDKLDEDDAMDLLSKISPRRASSFVQHLGDEQRERILSTMSDRKAAALRELALYPDDTAGAMMELHVVTIQEEMNAQQAINAIRKSPREQLHYLYVTDRKQKLIGVIGIRDLLLASPRDSIRNFLRRDVFSVADTMNRDEVIDLMQEKGYVAIPVVDFEGHLVGIIRHTEAIEGVQQELLGDLQKIVGAGADERALSPVSLVVRSRLPWLFVNLLTAFLAAAVVGLFEGIIAQVAALAVLLPVVAGQGGNTGSQSLAVVMRGLALREIVPGVKKKVIAKEAIGGLINGLLVALVTAGAVLAWRIIKKDPTSDALALAFVIGLAMIVNMGAAAFSGAVIPLILRALGRDPAQSASIFLTTVTDIVGFAAFLGFAVLFLPVSN